MPTRPTPEPRRDHSLILRRLIAAIEADLAQPGMHGDRWSRARGELLDAMEAARAALRDSGHETAASLARVASEMESL